MAKISVVMCCYNAEKYIKETIDSVLAQTFKDFEFIIWNDGSTDSTLSVIENYNDSRIKLFTDVNRGEGMAAQLACRHASAKYIARIDSDDVWLPEKLSLQYDYMETHPHTVLLSCPVIFIDKNSKELGLSFPITKVSYLNKSMAYENKFPHSGSIYRTEIYKKVGGYNDVRLFQDWLLFGKLKDFGDVALFSRPLIKYRLMAGSVAHRLDNSPYRFIIKAYVDKIYKEKGTNDVDIKLFNNIYSMIGGGDQRDYVYEQDLQNKLYNIMCKVIGKSFSYKLIVFTKNMMSL